MSLADRVVLVTGATGGLGPAVVRQVYGTGARLALAARRQEALQELVQQLALDSERVLCVPTDLSAASAVQALVEAVLERWGGVDVLLNLVGGWSGGKRLADLDEEEWQATLTLNLHSAYLVSRAVIPCMVKRGWGRIVHIASKAAEQPAARQAAYNVAKAGVVALAQSIAVDYRRQGITANVLLPSIIDTPDNRKQTPEADFSRWVKPEELAAAMLYLCSDEAASINGASIAVYGGV